MAFFKSFQQNLPSVSSLVDTISNAVEDLTTAVGEVSYAFTDSVAEQVTSMINGFRPEAVPSYPWPPWLPLSVVPHPPTPGTFRAAAALIFLHLSLSHWQHFLVYWICYHSAMCFPNLQNPNTVLSSFFSFTFLCDCLYFFLNSLSFIFIGFSVFRTLKRTAVTHVTLSPETLA